MPPHPDIIARSGLYRKANNGWLHIETHRLTIAIRQALAELPSDIAIGQLEEHVMTALESHFGPPDFAASQ